MTLFYITLVILCIWTVLLVVLSQYVDNKFEQLNREKEQRARAKDRKLGKIDRRNRR